MVLRRPVEPATQSGRCVAITEVAAALLEVGPIFPAGSSRTSRPKLASSVRGTAALSAYRIDPRRSNLLHQSCHCPFKRPGLETGLLSAMDSLRRSESTAESVGHGGWQLHRSRSLCRPELHNRPPRSRHCPRADRVTSCATFLAIHCCPAPKHRTMLHSRYQRRTVRSLDFTECSGGPYSALVRRLSRRKRSIRHRSFIRTQTRALASSTRTPACAPCH